MSLVVLVERVAITFGILTNLLLMLLLFKLRKHKYLKHYRRLVGINVLTDLCFAIEQLFTQHSLVVKNGFTFRMSFGPERLLNDTNWVAVSCTAHMFFFVNTITMIPVLFHYRFKILIGQPKGTILLRNLLIGWLAALVTALPCGIGVYEAKQKPIEYLANALIGTRMEGLEKKLYASDSNDLSTILFMILIHIVLTISFVLVVIYVFKCYQTSRRAASSSNKTQRLQTQFTRCLLMQTFAGVIYGIGPVAWVMIHMVFGLYSESESILLPSTFLPLVNATFTIFMVTAFRRCFTNSILRVHSVTSD